MSTSDTAPHTNDRVTARDGTSIFFKDWGEGQPVVFSHGWPLNADAWDDQLNLVAANGFRAIAHDRRGGGRSGQPWHGNDIDTYADDLAALIESLDLHDAILVGHSTGGGEIARYIGRHGTSRVAKTVLRGAVPPHMLQTPENPDGAPMEVFDAIRAAVVTDRFQYYTESVDVFYGANRPGAAVSDGVKESFRRQCMATGLRGVLECLIAFSETDFTEDLRKFDVPTLVSHGDDDQIVPIAISGLKSAELIEGATLKISAGAPHGLVGFYADEFNADLMAFIDS